MGQVQCGCLMFGAKEMKVHWTSADMQNGEADSMPVVTTPQMFVWCAIILNIKILVRLL